MDLDLIIMKWAAQKGAVRAALCSIDSKKVAAEAVCAGSSLRAWLPFRSGIGSDDINVLTSFDPHLGWTYSIRLPRALRDLRCRCLRAL